MNYVIYRAVDLVFNIMEYAILARVLLSWIPLPNNLFTRLLYQITEPILGPVRSLLNKSAIGGNSMLDFSPIVAFILIGLVRNIILRLL
jgi:YggT family protein